MADSNHLPFFKIRVWQRPVRKTKKAVIEYWNSYHSAVAPWGGRFAPAKPDELEETGIARDELYNR